MALLLTVSDYKERHFADAPAFLNWNSNYYYSGFSLEPNNLLLRGSHNYTNPYAIATSNTSSDRHITTSNISRKNTLLTINIASMAENCYSDYCPTGLRFANSTLGTSDRYLVTNGSYSNNYRNVGIFDSTKIYNYLNGTMYRYNSNGTLVTLSNINSFISDCGLGISGYEQLANSDWLGIVIHLINYLSASGYDMWEYLYQDDQEGIWNNLSNYSHESYCYGPCLYNIVPYNSYSISGPLNTQKYTSCYDNRLNNNVNEIATDYVFSLGSLISGNYYNLIGLELIMSNVSTPSFSYYNGQWRDYYANTTSHSIPLLTPGIGYIGGNSDTNGDLYFNIEPYIYSRGSIGEVVAIRNTSASGNYEYVLGTRDIYSYFYPIPIIGGNSSNLFYPTSRLADTNNEIHAILHTCGQPDDFLDL